MANDVVRMVLTVIDHDQDDQEFSVIVTAELTDGHDIVLDACDLDRELHQQAAPLFKLVAPWIAHLTEPPLEVIAYTLMFNGAILSTAVRRPVA